MPSITIPVSEKFKQELEHFSWVNWSELSRAEARKKVIFEDFLKKGDLSDEDWEFCEDQDWHPADWLPLREGFVRRMEEIRKEKTIKIKSFSEIFE